MAYQKEITWHGAKILLSGVIRRANGILDEMDLAKRNEIRERLAKIDVDKLTKHSGLRRYLKNTRYPNLRLLLNRNHSYENSVLVFV